MYQSGFRAAAKTLGLGTTPAALVDDAFPLIEGDRVTFIASF